ncbi:hypothetical protein CLOAM0432 [Candidatus Cloacimonas acidaminovorans str. Evry]|uniref:Uncharacterized protein n=1 Tax=Cloacimonas acidaminovorans (strain Evry) TaxID=459349 RepID=B0VJW2_CLOAI|nr:hypothetical protein CLOAM0432 [Candidatus Cloacimonas acidaminovorans str. Evry]
MKKHIITGLDIMKLQKNLDLNSDVQNVTQIKKRG